MHETESAKQPKTERTRVYIDQGKRIHTRQFLSDNARKYFNQAEVQRLLQQRKRRLAK